MTEPAPLVPAEVNLRGLPWMPIDTVRLLDSDLNSLSKGDEFKAAVRLWCKAWYQVPAASLPDDDAILASLSGFGARWKKLRPMALRGFLKCSDGRLYHPVIAEKALEAWEHRKAQRNRAAKRWQCHGNAAADAEADAEAYPTAMQGTGTEIGTGKRQGQGQKQEKPYAARKNPRTSASGNGEGPVTLDLWQAYAVAYQTRYGVPPVRNRKVNAMLAKFIDRVGAADAPDIAGWYIASNRGLYVSSRHCVDLLLRDAEALAMECKTGRRMTDGQARQTDQTATRGQVFLDLLENPKGNA